MRGHLSELEKWLVNFIHRSHQSSSSSLRVLWRRFAVFFEEL